MLTCVHGVARLWDLATGQTIVGWPISGNGGGAFLMPDGKHFLDAHQMRDLQTGAVLWSVDGRHPIGRVRSLPDGSRFTSSGYGLFYGTQLYDSGNGKILGQRPDSEPLAFSPDGRTLYVRTRDWHVLGLDTANGAARYRLIASAPSTGTLSILRPMASAPSRPITKV